jgi:hypothetical protein
MEWPNPGPENEKTPANRGSSSAAIARHGFDHPSDSSLKTANPESGDAQSDARGLGSAILADDRDSLADPALARLLAVWDALTDGDRQRLAADAERLAGLPDGSEPVGDLDPDE